MRYPLLFTLLSLTAGDGFSQAPEPVEVRTASHSDGTCSVEWDTVNNHTYFMQVSPTLTEDSWRYLPVIESGDGQLRRYGLQDPSGRGFFRLRYTNQLVVGPVGEFDFDGDGYGSMDELTILNTDPLDADSNGDGTLDGQEDTDNDGVEDGYELLISAASGADNYTGLRSISLANAGTAGRLTGQGGLRGTGEGDTSGELPPINVWTQSRSFRVSIFDPNPTGLVSNEFFISESGSPSELHPYIDVAHFYEFEANRPPADARALQSFDGFDFPADEEEGVSSIKWENNVEHVIGEGVRPIIESQEEWHRELPSISEGGVDTGSDFRKHQFRLVVDRVLTEEDAPVKQTFLGVKYQKDDAGEIVNVEATGADVTLEIPVGKDRSPAHEPVPEQHDGFTYANLPVVVSSPHSSNVRQTFFDAKDDEIYRCPNSVKGADKDKVEQNALVIYHNDAPKGESPGKRYPVANFSVGGIEEINGLSWTCSRKSKNGHKFEPAGEGKTTWQTDGGEAVGGLYRYHLEGTEYYANVWLPLAGPDIAEFWESEVDYFRGVWKENYQAKLRRIVRPFQNSLILRQTAIETAQFRDMRRIGGTLDWRDNIPGPITAMHSPTSGPRGNSGGVRYTIHERVMDFKKGNNMMYALIGRCMGISEKLLIAAGDPSTFTGKLSGATGAPDTPATVESYRAGFDLFRNSPLKQVIHSRAEKMQEPGSWAQKEWPSEEKSNASLNRVMAVALQAILTE